MPVKRGSFIVFEGIDGSGKSTQLELLAASLREAGHDVLVTREPTDGPAGRRIREMLEGDEAVAPEQELAWFFEDRAEHVRDVIAPALEAGLVVVCDRYFLSTVAYQGARGFDWPQILADSEARFPVPDLVLLLQVSPEAGLTRTETRTGHAEPIFENAEFLNRVAGIFAEIERPWIARLSGDADPDRVSDAVRGAVARTLDLLPD
jgi:dTMP kinase